MEKDSDELSFRDLIIAVQQWWKYLFGKKVLIILISLSGALLGLGLALISKPKYEAELTFVMEEHDSNPLAAYSGLASQLGLNLGSTSSGVFEGENIIEFLKSRLMIEKSLLSAVKTVDNKQMTLAEYFIDINSLRDKWKKRDELKDIHFPLNVDRSRYTRVQDSILNFIHQKISDDYLLIEKTDKKLNFISVKCVSSDEIFSNVFVNQLVKEATEFYVNTKTKKTKASVDRLQVQSDSLRMMLNAKTQSVASLQDINLNPARQSATVSSEIAVRDKVVLQTMYGEIVKNLEMSKIAMAQETPFIQIIDTPIYPLKIKKLGKTKAIIIGGILAGILTVIVLVIRKFFRDILVER